MRLRLVGLLCAFSLVGCASVHNKDDRLPRERRRELKQVDRIWSESMRTVEGKEQGKMTDQAIHEEALVPFERVTGLSFFAEADEGGVHLTDPEKAVRTYKSWYVENRNQLYIDRASGEIRVCAVEVRAAGVCTQ